MDSNVHLSPSEKELFCNAEIILTKNAIIRKTILLLEDLQQAMVNENIAHDFSSVPPKISKGENYMGLPYVILDYPRKADTGDILFIRSMFWWGNFYSSTLHISGKYRDEYRQNLIRGFEQLRGRNFHLGVGEDPWKHHFETDNYQPVGDMVLSDFARAVEQQEHIKLAAKWPLDQWDDAAQKLWESWKFLLDLIS